MTTGVFIILMKDISNPFVREYISKSISIHG